MSETSMMSCRYYQGDAMHGTVSPKCMVQLLFSFIRWREMALLVFYTILVHRRRTLIRGPCIRIPCGSHSPYEPDALPTGVLGYPWAWLMSKVSSTGIGRVEQTRSQPCMRKPTIALLFYAHRHWGKARLNVSWWGLAEATDCLRWEEPYWAKAFIVQYDSSQSLH